MHRHLGLASALALLPLAAVALDPGAAGAAAEGTAEAPVGTGEAPRVLLEAPLFSNDFATFPVARIEDRVITLREVTEALAGSHGAREGGTKTKAVDVMPIVDRLIDVHLLGMEARNMGMGDLPEFEKMVAGFEESAGREMLKDRVTAGAKPDAGEVERQYRDAIRTWKARSLLFTNESDALKLKAEVDAGKAFGALAKQAVADGKAKGSDEAQALPRAKLLPNVLAVLERSKAGDVTAPLKVEEGWAVLEVQEILYPDDPKARAGIEQARLADAKTKALAKYYEGLVRRHAKVDRKLLASLDYSDKSLPALKKDRRVLARIQGAKPIVVADLTEALLGGFYHGADRAVKAKKINRQKADVFDGLLSQRIVPLEVKRVGISETAEYKRRIAAYQDSLLFSGFVSQVIAPKVKVEDEAKRKYYEEHRAEFTFPPFYKLESLAFADVKAAQGAVDKLRAGTDFKWLNANSEQVKPAERKAKLDGTIAASSLPKDLASALAGAKAGDHRLYADPSSQFYAIHVVDVVPAQEQPFEEVRGKIEERLFYEQINAAIKDWAGKLRKASDVKVYITRIDS